MPDRLSVARAFIEAVVARRADVAAGLCTDQVEVLLPGASAPLRGRDGVRQMVQIAPTLEQTFRSEEEGPNGVRVTTLTRAPGIFANYTTWVFEIERGLVRKLSFELRAAN